MPSRADLAAYTFRVLRARADYLTHDSQREDRPAMFTDPDPEPRVKSRNACPACEATPGGCYCCEACGLHGGDHDRSA